RSFACRLSGQRWGAIFSLTTFPQLGQKRTAASLRRWLRFGQLDDCNGLPSGRRSGGGGEKRGAHPLIADERGAALSWWRRRESKYPKADAVTTRRHSVSPALAPGRIGSRPS